MKDELGKMWEIGSGIIALKMLGVAWETLTSNNDFVFDMLAHVEDSDKKLLLMGHFLQNTPGLLDWYKENHPANFNKLGDALRIITDKYQLEDFPIQLERFNQPTPTFAALGIKRLAKPITLPLRAAVNIVTVIPLKNARPLKQFGFWAANIVKYPIKLVGKTVKTAARFAGDLTLRVNPIAVGVAVGTTAASTHSNHPAIERWINFKRKLYHFGDNMAAKFKTSERAFQRQYDRQMNGEFHASKAKAYKYYFSSFVIFGRRCFLWCLLRIKC